MTAIAVWRAAQAAGITITAGAQGKLICRPRAAVTDEIAHWITIHRAAILEYLHCGHLGALVPPETRGMDFETWHTQELMKQAREHRAALRREQNDQPERTHTHHEPQQRITY